MLCTTPCCVLHHCKGERDRGVAPHTEVAIRSVYILRGGVMQLQLCDKVTFYRRCRMYMVVYF